MKKLIILTMLFLTSCSAYNSNLCKWEEDRIETCANYLLADKTTWFNACKCVNLREYLKLKDINQK